MAKIGIDARIWGIKNTGIGRYTEELVKNLQLINKGNEYVIFCRRGDYNEIPVCSGWKKVIVDIPHYTLQEQVKLPGIFTRERLDLLHVPHFNVPLFYRGKFVVTIHDILWHHVKNSNATTLSAPVHLVKHLGYRLVVKNAVARAQRVIVPSKAVAEDIIAQFSLPKDKVVVTYEGVTSVVSSIKYSVSSILAEYRIEKPYLLYVGNLYPHKNVESVVCALKHFNTLKYQSKTNQNLSSTAYNPNQNLSSTAYKLYLVVVSGRNIFRVEFEKFLEEKGADGFARVLEHVPDEKLAVLYEGATAFIFPTLSEGFGLPGLEAMSFGTPVACSNIPVLQEIYDDTALYFDPLDVNDIADKIMQIIMNNKLRKELIHLGKQQVKKYSWRKMAKETLDVYKSVLGDSK